MTDFLFSKLPYAKDNVPAGVVTSVSGTANRISSTGGATPVIDIDAAYIGQASLYLQGALSATGIRTQAAASTNAVKGTDFTILCDCTANNITVNLPAVATSTGMVLNVKKIDAGANTVTIDGNAAETIDGAATKVISAQYTSLQLHCDGAAWYLL